LANIANNSVILIYRETSSEVIGS